MGGMHAIARRGSQVLVGESLDRDARGRIVDVNRRIAFPVMHVHSILARGYWEPFEGDQTEAVTLAMTAAGFDESKVRRHPKGTPVRGPEGGGRFAPKGTPIDTSGPSSQEIHLGENGEYNEQRMQVHNRLIRRHLTGRPQDRPVTLFMAGGPGAGKSTILEMLSDVPPDATVVNPDDFKKSLPEWKQLQAAMDPNASAWLHEESSDLAARLLAEANEANHHVIIDGTGDSDPGKFLGKIRNAEALGRPVKVVLVDIPTEEAVNRALARATNPASPDYGRMVHEDLIRFTHRSVTARHLEWRSEVDNWEVWANDEGPDGKRVIARRVNGGPIETLEPERYAQAVAKADEGGA